MAFNVRLTERAKRDFNRTVLWLAENSPPSAVRLEQAFEDAVDRFSRSPLSCGLAPESVHAGFDVRQFFFKTPRGKQHRALFSIIEGEIWILHVRGPGQDLVRDIGPP